MTIYFAYGSNMSRALMRHHCPSAAAIGTAILDDHRFVITTDGYASVLPRRGAVVRGVLWRLTTRDLAALNAYESVNSGLYRISALPVRTRGRRATALVYVARSRVAGQPKPNYLELIVAAARAWRLPDDYVEGLARWSASGLRTMQAAAIEGPA